jgi:hypothetical protein
MLKVARLADIAVPKSASESQRHTGKALQIDEADARTRTGDPFITSEVLYQLSYVGEA